MVKWSNPYAAVRRNDTAKTACVCVCVCVERFYHFVEFIQANCVSVEFFFPYSLCFFSFGVALFISFFSFRLPFSVVNFSRKAIIFIFSFLLFLNVFLHNLLCNFIRCTGHEKGKKIITTKKKKNKQTTEKNRSHTK